MQTKQIFLRFDCIVFVDTYCWNVDMCTVSPSHHKVMKAEHGRQILQKLTANLELLIPDDTQRESLQTQLSRNVWMC